jgi:hypothetical protein
MQNQMPNKIPAAEINYGVYFQFNESGDICIAHHRYIRNGLRLTYFHKNKLKAAKYRTSANARARLLILREDVSGSARQRNRLKIIEQVN